MAKRSDLDLAVGHLIRDRVPLRCPHCGTVTIWVSVDEYGTHREKCAHIELGQIVGKVEKPPVDDLLPVVDRKPPGWRWGK